jgi:hypothetical protein
MTSWSRLVHVASLGVILDKAMENPFELPGDLCCLPFLLVFLGYFVEFISHFLLVIRRTLY